MGETLTCGVDLAPLRARPDEGADQVTQALRGEPLQIVERCDGWARVLTAYEYPGWIEAAALSTEPAGEWLPRRRAGDPVEEARAYLGVLYLWGGMSGRAVVEEAEPGPLREIRRGSSACGPWTNYLIRAKARPPRRRCTARGRC